MPCWPEVWEHAKALLPVAAVVSVFPVIAVIIAVLFWAPRIEQRWLRISSRILGAALLVPFLMMLTLAMFGFMITGGNPPTESRTVKSNDGAEATLNYDGGFLGRDYTFVTLKRRAECRHVQVFWLAGPSSFDDAKLEWLDNQHLRISYHARPGDRQHCESQLGEIKISCSSQPWPDVQKNTMSPE